MPKAPQKLDLYKDLKDEYAARKDPCLVNVKPGRFLAISGQGEPGGELFQKHIAALYSAAYTMKMSRKLAGKAPDYKVCGLEGLWRPDDPSRCIEEQPKSSWHWTLLIRIPAFITARDLKQAVVTLKEKGRGAPEHDQLKLETIREGKCVQVLHVGPYDKEAETIAGMRAFGEQSGLQLEWPHHEIYLSDPRRVPPERLRTILRAPVTAAGARAATA